MHNIRHSFDLDLFRAEGYCLYPQMISEKVCDVLIEALEKGVSPAASGVRNLEKKVPAVRDLVQDRDVLAVAAHILEGPPALVRAIFFDKTPSANWGVVWHQDKTIAVDRRMDIHGWGPWTVKDGQHHVQPDISMLEAMVTFRIHLDPADEENGCLMVIPGSHRRGVLSQSIIDELKVKEAGVACRAGAGDAVIMRPHILQSSRKAEKPYRRRVIHLEYSGYTLPAPMAWASQGRL